jgi:hypothetical protein
LNVREKCKALVDLVESPERLADEREKARKVPINPKP